MPDDRTSDNSMFESATIEPLEREQRLYERVVEKVLELISSGAWKSGFRLPSERELSEAFGVSRTVVREAVKALEARGYSSQRLAVGFRFGRPISVWYRAP